MYSLKVQTIRTFDELDSIKNHWLELEKKDTQSFIYQSWDWNRLWCEHVLAHNNKTTLDIKLIEDSSGKTLALLPFFKTSLAGPLLRITQFLGHKMSSRNTVLISEPNDHALADQIVHLMINDLGRNDLLHLRHLSSESLFTQALIKKNLAVPQCKSLWVANDPNITDQLTRLGKSSRKALRKAKNRLAKDFDYKVTVSSPTTFSQAFDDWYTLHALRFQTKRRQTLLTGYNLDFLKAVTSSPARAANFQIISLQVDNKTIAAKLLINDQARCFAYQSGFDPEFSRYAPARVLMSELMRHAFEDLNCETVDFGPGYEQNKYEWSPSANLNYSCCLGGKGVYIKSLTALYRHAFHKRLPPV
jgi:CelD/BcsL family acetyltransferase involved in cellulose biosynthesis